MPDFRALQQRVPIDEDYPQRTYDIQWMIKVLDGKLYDHLKHPFGEEKSDSNEYVKLGDRRPSARTRICRTVVNDSVAMLFDDDHFPGIECKDENTRESLTAFLKDIGARATMIEAATRGSVGSIAILLRVLKQRVFLNVLETPFLTPKWKADAPDTLESVTERYKIKGHSLKAAGYPIEDKNLTTDYWFQRVWDESAETWFTPVEVATTEPQKPLTIDSQRTVQHALGFVPIIWIKNLPGGNGVDGEPTFPLEAIDMQIECDYLMSQGGRALKYQSDPTLIIKERPYAAGMPAQPQVKGAANVIKVSPDGDAKLLEITGEGPKSVMEWVRMLRELALEGAGGNRTNADKISAAQSGRAMELMHQALINLTSKLRISYGDNGLQAIIDMIVRASQKIQLKNKRGDNVEKFSSKEPFSLQWPRWFAPTYADRNTESTTLTTLRSGNLISVETAVKSIAQSYDIADVEEEIKQIEADTPEPEGVQVAKLKQQPLSQSDD